MLALAALVCVGESLAQNRTGSLRGQVTDPSGGAVANAAVQVITPAGQVLARATDANGAFEANDLAPGDYSLEIAVQGFAPYQQVFSIVAGQLQQLNISLSIVTQQQEVTVSEVAPTVDATPSSNASSVIMTGSDLEALADDPDQLEADLQALAGPSAGPNGGEIYVDGFSGGRLPPKSSIREIRINQNPFSAQFDRMGFGRIEVLTRPGTDTLHGRFGVQGNSSAFNTKSPFVSAENQVPYDSINFDGNIGGSLRGVASYTISAFRRNINNSSIVSAVMLDPSFTNQVPFNTSIGTPQRRTNFDPRLDYQISRDNTLTVRYEYSRDDRSNLGVGQFSLPEQAYDDLETEHRLQVSDTQILGESAVNETRFQYITSRNSITPQNAGFTERVTGAFTGGGSSRNSVTQTRSYEVQNYTSLVWRTHVSKFGVRVRGSRIVDDSMSNFNGTYTFSSLDAYQATKLGLEQGASQFSITSGEPRASVHVVDLGLYFQDDWRLRPNFTLSYGLRFETQNKIPDHVDVAPRIGLAWALGSGGRPTVIRAGFGLFYDRFDEGDVLEVERFNGVTQQEYIVALPDCYPGCSVSNLTGAQTSPTVYQIDPNLRSPYIMQAAVSVERQITRIANMSVNYLNSRGVHYLLTNNLNAPLPGSGTLPFGDVGNIYQYQSHGVFRQHQLITTLNVRAAARLSLFGRYVWNHARGNTSNGGFPSNPYDLNQDYGRANFDVRHRVNVGGTIGLPYAFRLSPFITMQSGQPFNITVGEDLNGDSIFNDRPAFAASQTLPENLVVTEWGRFDTLPGLGATIIPINYGAGTSRFSVNMRLGKTFSFGGGERRAAAGGGAAPGGPGGGGPGGFGGGGGRPGGPGGPGGGGGGGRPGGFGGGGGAGNQRYSITFNVDARNVFNIVNYGNPVGNLSSPLFGQANSLAGGPYSSGAAVRRIDLQLVFGF
jgi:hypothetical protein